MKCVSLFSGCGGLDLGLTNAGFDVIFATDNSEVCSKSHSFNFPHTRFHLGGIETVTRDFLLKEFKSTQAGEIDLLAGGPPCQSFSKSRFYRKEKPRALEDPNGMATIQGYLRTLAVLKPKAFILENVAGFTFKNQKEAFDLVKRTAEDLGYSCSWMVVNAAHYGVPQIRQRFFMIGVTNGAFAFPQATHFESPVNGSNEKKWVSAGDVICDLDSEENACDEGHFAGGKHHELLKEIPPGENYLFFTEKRGHPNPQFKWRSRYWSFLLKLSPDLPSWTIQARRSNNMGPLHWRNRILRIEEVKRLQTFPDDFYLSGTTEQQWHQVGNAVPPLLAEVLGCSIKRHLMGYCDGPNERSKELV